MTPEQSEKPSNGSWSVTVSRAPAAKPTVQPAAADQPAKPKHDPAGKHMQPVKIELPPADASAPAAASGEAVAKAPDGSWAVTVNREPPPAQAPKPRGAAQPAKPKAVPASAPKTFVKTPERASEHRTPVKVKPLASAKPEPPAPHKLAVKVHHAEAAAPDHAERPPAPARRSGVRLMPIVLCAAAVLLVGLGISRQRAKQAAARQQSTQAYATVTGYLTRMDALKKQVPACQSQLDGPISDLQHPAAAPASGKDRKQRVEDAITAVKTVEKKVLDAETGEEQAQQALAVLQQHAEYAALAAKVSAASAEYKALQQGVETKCQALRALIMAANQR
jgi:hypothetical protein